MWRRQATGTVAELLGPSEIKRDIGTRLFRYRGDMEREYAHYQPPRGPDVAISREFWQEMVENTSFVSREWLRKIPESTTLGQPGRMSVNQALWAQHQVPAYLIELKVEKVNKLEGRRLPTDWLLLGPGLVRGAVAAVK